MAYNKTTWIDGITQITATEMNRIENGIAAAQGTSVAQIAAGTANAIALSGVELVTGAMVSFIVAAANNGGATTVNSKPLYRPNSVAPPNLIAGKLVSIWYSATGNCFFFNASADGNAVAADVLAGKTFSNDNDSGLIGTLAINAGDVKTGVTIGGTTGNFTADSDAVAAGILAPQTAFVKGSKVHGNIPSKAAETFYPNAGNQLISAGQYLAGQQLIASLGGNAQQAHVLAGASFSSNAVGREVAGAMPNNGAAGAVLPINGTHIIPAGYHNGGGAVTQSLPVRGASTITPSAVNQSIAANQWLSGIQTIAGDSNLAAGNIKKGVTLFGHVGTYQGGIASGTVIPVYDGYRYRCTVAGLPFIPKTVIWWYDTPSGNTGNNEAGFGFNALAFPGNGQLKYYDGPYDRTYETNGFRCQGNTFFTRTEDGSNMYFDNTTVFWFPGVAGRTYNYVISG